jgi:hypothetical protein
MCSFLISNDAERISGQVIPVDGNATRMDWYKNLYLKIMSYDL